MREVWYTRVVVAVVAASVAVAGCDGATGPGDGSPEGNYTLTTVDAKALPFMMYSDTAYTLEVTAGSLTISTGGKWVAKATTRETVAGNVSMYSDSTFGTWTLATGGKTAVLLNTETNVSSNATWTATDITVDDVDGTVTRKVVYRRS